MAFQWVIAFLVGIADLAVGGLISNGFMVTMMIMEWIKCKRLGTNGQLLLSVGLANVCDTASLVAFLIVFYLSNTDNNIGHQIFFFIASSFTFLRFWLAAWLCVFYCIKIMNSTCSFILWCKQKISWLIPRLILSAVLISFLISSISGVTNVICSPMNATQSNITGTVTNETQGKKQIEMFGFYLPFFIIIGNACPFVVVLFCSILSIASLCRHLHHMTRGESSFQSLQTRAHIKAIGTMVSLFFLYFALYVLHNFGIARYAQGQEIFVLSGLMIILCSSFQAAILLLANPKLKHAASQILQRILI